MDCPSNRTAHPSFSRILSLGAKKYTKNSKTGLAFSKCHVRIKEHCIDALQQTYGG
jgi:hypothetical protein